MRNTYLVFRRDYLGYVSAWGFWVGLAALPVIMAAAIAIGYFAASSAPVRYFAVIETGNTYAAQIEQEFADAEARQRELARESAAALGQDLPDEATGASSELGAKFIRVDPPARTVDELRPWLLGEREIDGPDGPKPLFAAILVPDGEDRIEYWSQDVTVQELRSRVETAARTIARNRTFAEANIDPAILERADDSALPVLEQRIRTSEEQATAGNEVTLADRAPFFVSLGISYTLWLMIFSVIQYLLMGTIEERSNKIFDTLLTSVRLPQLLTGKLAAVFAVTMTMMGTWIIIGMVLSGFGVASLPPEVREGISAGVGAALQPSILLPALISFVFGYLLFGVVFIALGSLCDTIQEAQTLMSPIIMILMLPMFMLVIALEDPTSPVVAIASWIPLFTPFLLILRMPTEPPLWEVIGQISLMAATTMLVLWLATKVYRAGAVHGAGVSDAVDWLKRLVPGLGRKAAKPAE